MTKADALKSLLFEVLSEDPSHFAEIIQIATKGVKNYAEKQRDTSGALSARLITVLENNEISDFGLFSPEEMLSVLEPSYGGTVALKNLKKKYIDFGLFKKKKEKSDGRKKKSRTDN